jgi:predicted DNA-binding protein YlxM (UPF0122 family)
MKVDAKVSQEALLAQKERRQRIDMLCRRARLLHGRDRLLMTLYLERGSSFREIARLAGLNETTISRRVRKLIQQLLDDRYFLCMRHRDRFTCLELSIAKDYLLLDLPMTQIAEQRDLSYYQIRKTVDKIRWITATIRDTVRRQITPTEAGN